MIDLPLDRDLYSQIDIENGLTEGEVRVRSIVRQIRVIKKRVKELNLEIEEYYASHWRDDDCPLQETATGTTRRLVA